MFQNKLPTNCKPFIFLCTLYSKTTPTAIMHCMRYENHILSMTMFIRIELKFFLPNRHVSQFWTQKRESPRNDKTSKTIVCQTAPLAKLPHGGSYLFMKYDVYRENADFFKEWS